jgi:signal transduction histidine kinase/PAS domain-containing protein/ActR/RegA family two-component response regulator
MNTVAPSSHQTANSGENGLSETARLRALYGYEILDSDDEEDFDEIVRLAAEFFNVPMSLISFVDETRQWFKSKHGTQLRQTPIDQSFCRHTIAGDSMIVNDATRDPRFRDNPLVTGAPHLRFYAGATLTTPEGAPLGTICILDDKPRDMSEADMAALKALSRQVTTLLELKRALRDKQRSEERLQFALDTSAIIGTWDWDMRDDVIYCDARFSRMYLVDPEMGARGAPIGAFLEAVHPDDIARLRAKIAEAIETGSDFQEEYRLLYPDNETRWVHARGKALRDANGAPARFPGAAVDITDRKRAERKQAARVELNDRLRDIKHTPDVTFVAAEIIGNALEGCRAGYGEISADGETITILRDWTNGSVRSVAGTHEFRNYGTRFAEKIRQGEIVVINDVETDEGMADGIERVRGIDVRSLINVPLIENGKPRALFYIHDSRTRQWRPGEVELVIEMAHRTWAEAERVHAEEEMAAALKKAEAASVAKTEFLANMSHEIRTPMNAIIGLSNILANESLTPRQKEFVGTLQLSADSLLTLINDLLDISKIEARTVELERIPIDVARLVQEVISMMNVKAMEKNLSFSMETQCVENRMFLGDPTRLRQIIVNLCSNAIKFTDRGGIRIAIQCHETKLPGVEDICIMIEDTGIGIAEAKLETIFEKFVQADNSINRKYGGTGLGLAITKTLVTLMDGTIRVVSEEGVGSTFAVCIPLQRAEGASAPVDGMPVFTFKPHVAGAKRVLLVEDYAPNVLVAGTFLEEFGYEWDTAKSGAEALDMAIGGDYMAILMDVQMHGMNGLEATRLIRQHEKKTGRRRVPIIGMTAHALSGDRERCLGVGMDDYLAKPFNPDELEQKLRDIAESDAG